MSTERVNIPSGDDDEWVMGMGAFRILEAYASALNDDTLESLRRMMTGALTHFPELTGETVNVGQIPETDFSYARAFVKNRFICLPAYDPGHRPFWDIVYHELGHVAIEIRRERGEDVPHTSEEYCSIFAVSRMPVHRIERDNIDYLGTPTAEVDEWPIICQRALDYRQENGPGSHYIKRCREWLGVEDR